MQFERNVHPRRSMALLVAVSLVVPVFVAGCSSTNSNQNIPPPVDNTQTGQAAPPVAQQPQHAGMTTKQKVVILAGAALLYYLYKHHQQQQNQQVQYYLSKNGRVYYRDPQTHQVHWVTPVQVPASEAQEYSQYQGYNNQATGQSYGTVTEPNG